MKKFASSIMSVLAIVIMLLASGQGHAQSLVELRNQVNAGTVGIIAGRADSAFTRLADDLGVALDDGNNLRVLTVLGSGSLKNIEDLITLKGVDVAITQSDTLAFYEKINVIPGIKNYVRYITKIHNEEFHLLTSANIKNIRELQGKKVNFGRSGTGTFMTSSVVFDALDITVEVTDYPHRKAYELLKAGEIDAMAKVDGKPVEVISDASIDDGVHLIPVPAAELSELYESSSLKYEDYPTLFATRDDFVETVSVSSVMASYNWPSDHPRRAKLDRFTAKMFKNIAELKDPSNGYDPKWAGVELDGEVVGWERDPGMEKILTPATQ